MLFLSHASPREGHVLNSSILTFYSETEMPVLPRPAFSNASETLSFRPDLPKPMLRPQVVVMGGGAFGTAMAAHVAAAPGKILV